MNSIFLVRSEHMTHEGRLFGGDLMAEIDSISYCLLRETYPGRSFVTRAAEIGFERSARLGDVINFSAEPERVGNTSVAVRVLGHVGEERICSAKVVFVRVGPDGKKMAMEE